MRIRLFYLLFCLLLCGCSASQPTVPAPSSSPTPISDDLGIYREGLVSTSLNDLNRLDHPTRYNLVLAFTSSPPTLKGSESVLYTNRESGPLNEVYFRLFANYPGAGGRIDVTGLEVDGTSVTPVLEVQDTAMRVPLSKPLPRGATINIKMQFSVSIPETSKHYADFLAGNTVVTLPTVYPLIPAYDSGGWHIELPPAYGDLVYADVSLYTVTVTVPSKMSVIASGSAVSTSDNGDGTKTWKLVGAPMRDWDLNLSSTLQSSSQTVGETTINSWYEPSDVQTGKDALKFAVDALGIFQKRFGTFPYRELDVVETPTTAGGIEYPGIVVVGRSLYQDSRNRSFFEFATVHEVSHQWWYGLVGDDQVNYPWVDEALAQYSTLIYEEDLHGSSAAQRVLGSYFQSIYDRAKGAGHDAAVNQPVSAFDEEDYGSIVYGKGPLFYDAIRRKMGDDKFFQFLRTYADDHRYGVAFPEDILKTAESTCGCSLQQEYKEWITGP